MLQGIALFIVILDTHKMSKSSKTSEASRIFKNILLNKKPKIEGAKNNGRLYTQYYFILFQYIPKWNPFVGKLYCKTVTIASFRYKFLLLLFSDNTIFRKSKNNHSQNPINLGVGIFLRSSFVSFFKSKCHITSN